MGKQIVRWECSSKFKGDIFTRSVASGQLIILCPWGPGLWEPHWDNMIHSSPGPMARRSENAIQPQGAWTAWKKGESIHWGQASHPESGIEVERLGSAFPQLLGNEMHKGNLSLALLESSLAGSSHLEGLFCFYTDLCVHGTIARQLHTANA